MDEMESDELLGRSGRTAGSRSPLRPMSDAELTPERITYRLSKSDEELEEERLLDQDEDWTPFVLGAANAALLLFAVQALAALIVGHNMGAVIEIRFWYKVIPYIAFVTDRMTFVGIVTWSTAIATAAVCVGVLVALARHRATRVAQLRLLGWSAGLFMAGGLVVFQFIRHIQNPPVIDGWVSAQATAFIIVTALIFVGFKPAPELPEPTNPSRDGFRPREVPEPAKGRTRPTSTTPSLRNPVLPRSDRS